MRDPLPRLRTVLLGAFAWGAAMAASAAFALWRAEWQDGPAAGRVILLFAVGAALAFVPALFSARLASRARSRQAAFAAALLALGTATAGTTALLYAVHYRAYYAEWHAEALSVTWAFQFFFTVAAAVYQFMVSGLRLYFPVGFMCLLVAALWFARRSR